MPTFGQLELNAIESRLPRMDGLDTEAWELPRVEILQLAWEVGRDTNSLLPRAMHPAVPPYATIVVTRYPESPVGPFALAQVRLMGRAGAHPRGFVLGGVASSPEAAAALRERWGFPVQPGVVTLRRSHDQVAAAVTLDGASILDVALVNPEPISGGDVQYIASVTLAHVAHDGTSAPWLVQVDPHYTFHRADRGRPLARRFDAIAWNAGRLQPLFPISGSLTTCDTDLPRIRYIMDPEVPVIRGTRRIR